MGSDGADLECQICSSDIVVSSLLLIYGPLVSLKKFLGSCAYTGYKLRVSIITGCKLAEY
jgi:hypothetical protein